MGYARRRLSKLFPVLVLFLEVLVFYRPVLFSRNLIIPFDLEGYHQPLAAFIASSLRNGALPLWDPYTYCGVPFYANLQAQLFYPPAWHVFLLGAINHRNLFRVLEIEVVLHVFLAGALTYWLLRLLNIGRGAALLGGTIFQLGGFFASQTQHLGAICGSAWMPLAWGSVLLLRERFTWKSFGLLAMAFAMAILSGFPATAAIVIGSSLFLAIILTLLLRGRAMLLPVTCAACAFGVALSAIALLPARELSRLSQASARGSWTVSGGGLPLEALVSMAIPNYYDIFKVEKFALHHIPANPTFLYLYCGLAGLFLGLSAVALSRHPDRWVFVLLTIVCALWMLCDATPVGRKIFPLLPATVRGGLYSEFASAAFLLGFTVLAGLGAEQILSQRGTALIAMVIAFTAWDLIRTGSNTYMNTDTGPGFSYAKLDSRRSLPERLRAMTAESLPPARLDVTGASHAWSVGAPLVRIPTANGDDPLALLRILKVRRCFASGDFWTRYYRVSKPESQVLDLLNIRFLLARSDQTIEAPKFILREDLEDGSHVYENFEALPRFFLVSRVRRAKNEDEAVSSLCSATFDPATTAIVENFAAAEPVTSTGAVSVLLYADSRVELETDAPGRSFLVTSEAFYPGWRAWVDGREYPLVLTNAAFRGLEIPPGRHRIQMRFEPRILWYGASISLLSLLFLVTQIRKELRHPAVPIN